MSIVVVLAFEGRVEALIPLYAIGVFVAFTLSQGGMVRHWFKERSPGWRRSALINGTGAVATAIVAVIFAFAKFAQGAWIVILIVPVLVGVMLFIQREYRAEEEGAAVRPSAVISRPSRKQEVFVAAPGVNRAVIQAINVARTMSPNVRVIHVTDNLVDGERVRERFARQVPDVDVVIVESSYRTLVRPFVRYLEIEKAARADSVFIVLIPQYVPRHWWDRVLYNQNGNRIREALVGRRNIVVLDVPYRRPA